MPRQEGSAKIKSLLIGGVVSAVLIFLSIPTVKTLNRKSLRAEARLILGYLATLENAYHVDYGKYAYFSDFYGAQHEGKENCFRPLGAEELGFILKNCLKAAEDGGLLYHYRVTDPVGEGKAFLGEAFSGSDISGRDFVCGQGGTEDYWTVGKEKQVEQVKHCQ